jgi:hypothetical protein
MNLTMHRALLTVPPLLSAVGNQRAIKKSKPTQPHKLRLAVCSGMLSQSIMKRMTYASAFRHASLPAEGDTKRSRRQNLSGLGSERGIYTHMFHVRSPPTVLWLQVIIAHPCVSIRFYSWLTAEERHRSPRKDRKRFVLVGSCSYRPDNYPRTGAPDFK